MQHREQGFGRLNVDRLSELDRASLRFHLHGVLLVALGRTSVQLALADAEVLSPLTRELATRLAVAPLLRAAECVAVALFRCVHLHYLPKSWSPDPVFAGDA